MLTTGAGTLAGAFDNTELDYYLSADDSKDITCHLENVRSRAMTHAAAGTANSGTDGSGEMRNDSNESACAYSCIWLLMFGTNHYIKINKIKITIIVEAPQIRPPIGNC